MGSDDVVDAGPRRRRGPPARSTGRCRSPRRWTSGSRSSKIADLAQHDWIRWGGGLFAAAFLREFTGGLPWAHLDIAGPAFNSGGPCGHVTSGGTGFAVATLVDYARALGADAPGVPDRPASSAERVLRTTSASSLLASFLRRL